MITCRFFYENFDMTEERVDAHRHDSVTSRFFGEIFDTKL